MAVRGGGFACCFQQADCGVPTPVPFVGADPQVACQGVQPVSTLVAKDLIAIIANVNAPYTGVTVAQLNSLFE